MFCDLIDEKPFAQLKVTDQKEIKHKCCWLFIFINLCVSQLLEEVQINNYAEADRGTNGMVAFRMLQHRHPILSPKQFSHH